MIDVVMHSGSQRGDYMGTVTSLFGINFRRLDSQPASVYRDKDGVHDVFGDPENPLPNFVEDHSRDGKRRLGHRDEVGDIEDRYSNCKTNVVDRDCGCCYTSTDTPGFGTKWMEAVAKRADRTILFRMMLDFRGTLVDVCRKMKLAEKNWRVTCLFEATKDGVTIANVPPIR